MNRKISFTLLFIAVLTLEMNAQDPIKDPAAWKRLPDITVVGRNSKGKGGSFLEKRAALKISSGDKGDVPVKTVNPLTVIIANKRGDGFLHAGSDY
jgi:hypothetical protein